MSANNTHIIPTMVIKKAEVEGSKEEVPSFKKNTFSESSTCSTKQNNEPEPQFSPGTVACGTQSSDSQKDLFGKKKRDSAGSTASDSDGCVESNFPDGKRKHVPRRNVDMIFKAEKEVPAQNFIPRFNNKDLIKFVMGYGRVGVKVFEWNDYEHTSPFVAMTDICVGPPLLFPDHPHYGHEFVLYCLEGEFSHEDFMGEKVNCAVGDTHWMTAGKGIVHAQKPGTSVKNRHIQWWVNLPKEKKLLDPRNQVLRSEEAPAWKECGGQVSVKLIAGSYGNHKSPIETQTALFMMDVTLAVGTDWELALPEHFTACIYVINGTGLVEGKEASEGFFVLSKCSPDGATHLNLSNAQSSGAYGKEWRVLVFAGKPIMEPIDVDGFFVCNCTGETARIVKDFDLREHGFAKAKGWVSESATVTQIAPIVSAADDEEHKDVPHDTDVSPS